MLKRDRYASQDGCMGSSGLGKVDECRTNDMGIQSQTTANRTYQETEDTALHMRRPRD